MKNLKNSRFLLPITVLIVFIINIVQGSFTELLPDEAYYWVYSQHMAWGFFDHPPMVALWIYISDFLFLGELGVRFFSAISFSILTYVVWKTIDHPRKKEFLWLFLLLFFSTALLNVYGFITTPDTPLMLFIAIFLFAYKEYLKKKSTLSYVLLAIAIAGMMYSKYQGILIVFFVLLSNWKLIKDYKLWLASLVALLLYLPHLNWQWMNDFPSFRYHLQERASNRAYKFEHTLMHFVNMIAIVGLTFPILYKAFFKNIRTKDSFSKSLNYIILGFLIFFFFSSFRGRVQAQWIVPISIPLILIAYDYLIHREKSRKWFVRLASINILIFIFARILLANEGIIPKKMNTHGNERWALELKEKTEGQDKIFINSYQNTATYWYYAKEKAYYMKNFTGRNNHFVMLQKEKDLSAKKSAFVSRIRLSHTDFPTQIRGKDSVFTSIVENYSDVSQLKMTVLSDTIILKKNVINRIPIEIENNSARIINFKNLEVSLSFLRDKKMELINIDVELVSNSPSVSAFGKQLATISFKGEQLPDKDMYPNMGIGITNSEKVDMIRVTKLLKYSVQD